MVFLFFCYLLSHSYLAYALIRVLDEVFPRILACFSSCVLFLLWSLIIVMWFFLLSTILLFSLSHTLALSLPRCFRVYALLFCVCSFPFILYSNKLLMSTLFSYHLSLCVALPKLVLPFLTYTAGLASEQALCERVWFISLLINPITLHIMLHPMI